MVARVALCPDCPTAPPLHHEPPQAAVYQQLRDDAAELTLLRRLHHVVRDGDHPAVAPTLRALQALKPEGGAPALHLVAPEQQEPTPLSAATELRPRADMVGVPRQPLEALVFGPALPGQHPNLAALRYALEAKTAAERHGMVVQDGAPSRPTLLRDAAALLERLASSADARTLGPDEATWPRLVHELLRAARP